MHMIKVGGKLGSVTPAPWVLPVTDAKDDGFKWPTVSSTYTVSVDETVDPYHLRQLHKSITYD